MVEAWLLAKRRAGMRGVQTDAMLRPELMCCSQCSGWRGRALGSGPPCPEGMCSSGSESAGAGVGALAGVARGEASGCCVRGAQQTALVGGNT